MKRIPSRCARPLLLAPLILSMTGALAADSAKTSPPTADKILEQVRDRDDGKDIYSEVVMELEDSKGKIRKREMYYLQKDQGQDSAMAIYFSSPADVKGVGFQTINYEESKQQEADQWMYLPAFRQNRRVSASDKRGAFMGSEYAYIDLDKVRVGDYRQTLAGEEEVGGRPSYKIERKPASDAIIRKTGYHKGIVWVDKERNILLRETYFDVKGIAFKTITALDVDEIDGVWTVLTSEAVNHVSGDKSRLIFSKVKYNVGIDEALFALPALKTALKSGKISIK